MSALANLIDAAFTIYIYLLIASAIMSWLTAFNVINVHTYVHKGEYFGVKTKLPQALRCNSGSPNIFEFVPPLVPGDPFADPIDDNGCDPLIELQYQ